MAPFVIIGAIVYFCSYILCAKGIDVPGPKVMTFDLTSPSEHNITIDEHVRLHLHSSVQNNGGIMEGECAATCTVDESLNISAFSCNVVLDTQAQSPYIDAITNSNVTREQNGKWSCQFIVTQKSRDEHGNYTEGAIAISYVFQLHVKIPEAPGLPSWVVVVIAIGILLLLIFIGQTICIIHFKREAKVVRRQAEWTSRRGSAEDTVRYSKMPIQKIKVEENLESRESGIYEALENVRVAPTSVPEPPPLKTLPRKDACNSTPVPIDPPAEPTTPRSFTNGMLLPFTNSLLRNKKKPKEAKDSGSDSKRSTIERIKVRPQYPPPANDKVYEAMENSPKPPRKEDKKNEIPKKDAKKEEIEQKVIVKKEIEKKENFRAFNTTSRVKNTLPAPAKFRSGAHTLQSQVFPSQLREQLKKRGNTVNLEPAQQELPLKSSPFSPGLQPQGATSLKPTPLTPRPDKNTPRPEKNTPRPEKNTPRSEKNTPRLEKNTPRPEKLTPRPEKNIPRPEIATSRPDMTTSNVISKFKPPPPVKPKQLHKLPSPPPTCRPESIRVTTEGGDDDDEDDEDWTYEPLPNYHIYSI